jgi:hypothetical protein
MTTQKTIDFSKNIKVSVEIQNLEKLGWNFDTNYEDVAKAQGITEQEAKVWENANYHAEISVDDTGYTSIRTVNTLKKDNRIDDGSNSEKTGDDEQTIKDLIQLNLEGLLWDIKILD